MSERLNRAVEAAIIAVAAILATLMIFLFQQLRNHEELQGHPGVLKITSKLKAQVESLSFQAAENRRRLALLEVRTEQLAEQDARMAEDLRTMETIPTLMARVATIESEVKILDQVRDEWIRRQIHPTDGNGSPK